VAGTGSWSRPWPPRTPAPHACGARAGDAVHGLGRRPGATVSRGGRRPWDGGRGAAPLRRREGGVSRRRRAVRGRSVPASAADAVATTAGDARGPRRRSKWRPVGPGAPDPQLDPLGPGRGHGPVDQACLPHPDDVMAHRSPHRVTAHRSPTVTSPSRPGAGRRCPGLGPDVPGPLYRRHRSGPSATGGPRCAFRGPSAVFPRPQVTESVAGGRLLSCGRGAGGRCLTGCACRDRRRHLARRSRGR
jgi:hypothetical protein